MLSCFKYFKGGIPVYEVSNKFNIPCGKDEVSSRTSGGIWHLRSQYSNKNKINIVRGKDRENYRTSSSAFEIYTKLLFLALLNENKSVIYNKTDNNMEFPILSLPYFCFLRPKNFLLGKVLNSATYKVHRFVKKPSALNCKRINLQILQLKLI